MRQLLNPLACASTIGFLLLGLGGCSGGSTSASSTLTVAGDVPIVYARRVNTIGLNPTDGTPFAAGGDLMLREKSSASAIEHNLTAQFTQGNGDASDPEVSYDGKKVVFSMKCPTTNTSMINGAAACTGMWNIWEYDTTGTSLDKASSAELTADRWRRRRPDTCPPRAFVFASNRQTKSGDRHRLPRAGRVRARARPQPAHDGQGRRRDHPDLVQPEP
jgi:hypothetical protein